MSYENRFLYLIRNTYITQFELKIITELRYLCYYVGYKKTKLVSIIYYYLQKLKYLYNYYIYIYIRYYIDYIIIIYNIITFYNSTYSITYDYSNADKFKNVKTN